MSLKGVRIGFALTASHCCLDDVLPQIRYLAHEGAEVLPVVSDAVSNTDTKYGTSQKWVKALTEITGRKVIDTIVGAEPIGPQKLLDILVVAPCTGNSLAKIANGITDGTVLFSVKAQLRNQRPVVLGISTNDGLSANARNIGHLLNIKNMYMVPFGQDNPVNKPNSLMAKWDLIPNTVTAALKGRQYQPLIIVY